MSRKHTIRRGDIGLGDTPAGGNAGSFASQERPAAPPPPSDLMVERVAEQAERAREQQEELKSIEWWIRSKRMNLMKLELAARTAAECPLAAEYVMREAPNPDDGSGPVWEFVGLNDAEGNPIPQHMYGRGFEWFAYRARGYEFDTMYGSRNVHINLMHAFSFMTDPDRETAAVEDLWQFERDAGNVTGRLVTRTDVEVMLSRECREKGVEMEPAEYDAYTEFLMESIAEDQYRALQERIASVVGEGFEDTDS